VRDPKLFLLFVLNNLSPSGLHRVCFDRGILKFFIQYCPWLATQSG